MDRNISDAYWEFLENEIIDVILEESQRDPAHMDISLILDGLDCIHPFDQREDEQRAQLAWQRFRQRHNIRSVLRRQRRHGRWRVVLLAAALFVLLLTGICQALGIDLWNIAFQWTTETLSMWLYPTSAMETVAADEPSAAASQSRDVWGDEIYDLMEEYNIHVSLPTWLPEGMECEWSGCNSNIDGTILASNYADGNNQKLHLSMTTNEAKDANYIVYIDYEANNDIQKVIKKGELEFYIMSNINRTSITWIDGICEVVISGNFPYETVLKIIDSI